MGYAMEIFQHGQRLDRDRCLFKYIFGPWSCLKCKYLNFWGNYECNNCSHEWETPNKRLVKDGDFAELQPGTDEYWLTFFTNPLHVEGKSYAHQIHFDTMFDAEKRYRYFDL